MPGETLDQTTTSRRPPSPVDDLGVWRIAGRSGAAWLTQPPGVHAGSVALTRILTRAKPLSVHPQTNRPDGPPSHTGITNGSRQSVPDKPWSGGVNDPRCLDDACYLLGSLSDAEEQEYQRHLRNCPGCRTSLQQLRPVVRLLALAIPDDVHSSSPGSTRP